VLARGKNNDARTIPVAYRTNFRMIMIVVLMGYFAAG
jgi:hypothetical protein